MSNRLAFPMYAVDSTDTLALWRAVQRLLVFLLPFGRMHSTGFVAFCWFVLEAARNFFAPSMIIFCKSAGSLL